MGGIGGPDGMKGLLEQVLSAPAVGAETAPSSADGGGDDSADTGFDNILAE